MKTRNWLLLLLSISSPQAFACFNGEHYAINHAQGDKIAFFAFGVVFVAIAIRLCRTKDRVYIPTLILIAMATALIVLRNQYNGDCGISYINIAEDCLFWSWFVLLYELIRMGIWRIRNHFVS